MKIKAHVAKDLSGFDRIRRKLADLGKPGKFELDELFVPSFIVEHTDYANFEEWSQASGISLEGEFAAPEWDDWVRQTTKFESARAMISAAYAAWINRGLGT